jgi:rsbT co-antagonist protein RsbR
MLMPLIGMIDPARTHQIREHLLEGTAHTGSSVASLEVKGVPVVGAFVADQPVETVAALQMPGPEGAVTGIGPDAARGCRGPVPGGNKKRFEGPWH